jgi:hypothetical protein
MGRPKKTRTDKALEIGRLEFVYEPGFERDWANVLASYIFHEIREDIKREVGDHL